MKQTSIILLLAGMCIFQVHAQRMRPSDNSWKKNYRSFPDKVNDMVHTKLEARLDYQHSQLHGKVWLTLTPHFYPVDSLTLDAKGMDILRVEMAGTPKNTTLHYRYDSLRLNIQLGKTYHPNEKYTVYIEYTSRPDDLPSGGSRAISSDKGLYFINPTGSDTTKPTQVWTQGETESNSAWVPLIDKPNQKSTHEIMLTVPDKYLTLSNGQLVSKKINNDGTRTDTWKMDQPIAPYLFFFGVGDYAVVKDSYKGKEVSYYVEKPYKDVARRIFGETPEMIRFYSQKLGIEYPWNKYAQMTARDYVSGAMENTTATLHGEWAQQNARQLVDGNNWETTIAHELFHQWFGDLVTCESWSNLTVNESLADFSEGMWAEFRHGKDEGEADFYNSLDAYLRSARDSSKALVRYYYADKEDMFDLVSYQKGGAILNMLRHYLGDDAFYRSLQLYLERNLYGTGNAAKLEQAFEDVTGLDLHWFFDEYYYGTGHPVLDISYAYDESRKEARVFVRQMQSNRIFKVPVKIDVYTGSSTVHYQRWIEHASDTLIFHAEQKPDLINFDADKVLVAAKTDHKSLQQFIFQYQHAGTYVDRLEAIEFAAAHRDDPQTLVFLKSALNDKNYRLRLNVLSLFNPAEMDDALTASVENIAKTDKNKLVRARAVSMLGSKKDAKYQDFFISCLKDSSYSVAGAAYDALISLDQDAALKWLPELRRDAKGNLAAAVEKADMLTKTDADFENVYNQFSKLYRYDQFRKLPGFLLYLSRINNVDNFKKGVDLIIQIRDQIVPFYPAFKDQVASQLGYIRAAKEKNLNKGIMPDEMKSQMNYLDSVLK